jgi:50S ribosome-binding GTPase
MRIQNFWTETVFNSTSPAKQRKRRRKRNCTSVMSAYVIVLAATSRFLPRSSNVRSNLIILSVSGWNTNNLATIQYDYGQRRTWIGSISRHSARNSKRPFTSRTATSSKNNINDPENRKNKQKNNGKKIRIAEEITDANMDKLAAAFDELARKEGFDASMQHFADDATFEDDFDDDDDADDFTDGTDDANGDDVNTRYEIDKKHVATTTESVEDLLDPSKFRLSDFSGQVDTHADNKENDLHISNIDDDDDDMDARINAARRDVTTGRVAVPKQLDRYAADNMVDLSSLGFRQEEDPWGIDELPRKKEMHEKKKEYQLVSNAMVCSACGADFQSTKDSRPGFLPPEKFATQVKLSKIEELQRLQTKAENKDLEWTPEDEVDWLIQSANGNSGPTSQGSAANIDINTMAEEMGLDLEEIAKKKTICKRCHGLQNFGKVDDVLRPGWTEEPLLSQEKFRDLLRPIREKPAVIIALVDLFDFSGSVLPELDNVAGDNPVILAANKADLLPAAMGQVRAENWVRRELEYLGVRSLANIGGAVRLVSCKTGIGVNAMVNKARTLADELDCDIYVVGAANAGKSTLLNYILGSDGNAEGDNLPKLRAGNRNKRKSEVTASPLPGTTLKFIQVDIGNGRSLFDTPGLLVPGTLTQLLTPDELKIVIPKK